MNKIEVGSYWNKNAPGWTDFGSGRLVQSNH